jgi:XRE family aerobic/anaerobic benzoate catabolism transcriptional regulator
MHMAMTPKRHAPLAAGPETTGSSSDPAYLRQLGERVRLLRARRGMTRKALAQHAGVSERYLAQLEAGAGNGSVMLLRRIARAIGVSLAELVAEEAEPPVDAVLLAQFLSRLPPGALTEARALLLRRFGDAGAARSRRIALVGLRGAGKSLIGSRLAERLGVPFIELDREIERLTGASLSEIFDMFGQETFRHAERQALDQVLAREDAFVMATSGSLVTEPGTLARLLASCFTIWLRASPAEHMRRVIAQGDLRPMASNPRAMDDLVAILKSREPLYARADTAIDTTGRPPAAIVAELARRIAQEPQPSHTEPAPSETHAHSHAQDHLHRT